jgi:hypothetical protein
MAAPSTTATTSAIPQGRSGRSGAATDVAQLVTILLGTSGNPALKQVTPNRCPQEAVLGAAQWAALPPPITSLGSMSRCRT